ncbi:unnamed protein product [Ciceribacter sp. T2.26MG-112.2]|nr:unnamed protein product [Ciceribacter naphthalenivorans]
MSWPESTANRRASLSTRALPVNQRPSRRNARHKPWIRLAA